MDIQINPNLNTIDWEYVSKLFELVKWGTRDPRDIKNAFIKSAVTCFISSNGNIIGFGRTVDDGKYYALLVDVVVHPEHQGKRVGTLIVNQLTKHLIGYEFITLTAAPNKEGFYQKIGWKKQKSSFIKPKDQKQAEEHCE